ncbi:ABC transporter substrate-binding protein [Microlunatus soli]|uniref:Peptide/nickel transport system substrate-binding protein n=1 Tax=Microlunatus soli TaxID=630515 RepID=A0A1H1PAT3_9ACTN|nr:ABC transporter substrate-binding protein [Microlunatus soli]SDS08361.1 peptide/nickel transport system substrate-binding protein [Microlunatus soli]
MKRSPDLRRASRLIVALLLLVVATAGCYAVQRPGPAPERPARPSDPIGQRQVVRGGDLVMGLSSEPDKLDPTTSTSLYTRYVMSSICEKLYDTDADGGIVPQLATALPTFSAGGRKVTIRVRDDIRFADGTRFDADAVRTSLLRHLKKSDSARVSELGPITSIGTQGTDKVVINYSSAFAPITASLADRAGMIMSPTALKKYGDSFADHPTCVGPFRFESRVPQTSITVVKDPKYYAADQIRLDSITYRIMSDANIRAANLRSGDIQIADSISPQDVDALSQEPGIGLLQTTSLGYQGLTINLGNTRGVGKKPGTINTPLAKDPRVREALAAAIDRDGLVNSAFNNWYAPACSPISPTSEFAGPAGDSCPDHDPAKAKKLLTAAGVPVPYPITVKVSNTADGLRFAQALQASVADAGFKITIEPVEYSTLLDQQSSGDFEAVLLGWSGRIDPHGNMYGFLATGGSTNYSGYSSPTVDKALTDATLTTDPKRRRALYDKVVGQVQQDNPLIYLYRQRNLTAYTDEIAGAATYPDGVVRLTRAGFVQEK